MCLRVLSPLPQTHQQEPRELIRELPDATESLQDVTGCCCLTDMI